MTLNVAGAMMDKTEEDIRRDVPVYINNFNMPTYTRRLVNSFRDNGFGNIIVIDQASEGQETQALLKELDLATDCRVIRKKKNNGPRFFFDSLGFLLAGRYFFYTDPDIELPEPLPKNFVTKMISISNRLRVGKVGCALDLSDSDLFDDIRSVQEGETTPTSIVEYESRYWKNEVEPNVYNAIVDTTLALYNNRYFRLWHFFHAVRIAGDFCVKHRPWYRDKRIPTAELDFYAACCRYSSWMNADTSGKSLFKKTPVIRLIDQVKSARWQWWQFKASVKNKVGYVRR